MALTALIILIITIVLFSGLVSGSEAALLSTSYAKAKELENSKKTRNKAKPLMKIKDEMQKYLTAIVILNNLINIVGSIYVGVLATELFGEIYLGIVSGILTFLIIIFAEILPKVYGEKYSTEISLIIARPIIIITTLIYPVVYIINKFTTKVVKENKENNISEGEIKQMATLGQIEGSLNKYETDIINNVFEMNDIEAYDIMVPKNKVEVIDSKSSLNSIVELVEKTGYTRFPIIENREIIGVINTKDLFKFLNKAADFSISKILRPVIFAADSMKIFALEQNLKKERTHMAIIVNEHGDFTGIVTLEDIIEELLGEIEDEFDHEEKLPYIKISENKYTVDATADIFELDEDLDLKLDLSDDEDFTTINGFLISEIGRIPKVNDIVKLKHTIFRVIKATKRKVLEVELVIKG
ncbi:MAG: hemolysin family protein [Candidatus Woesearchaeota archaeon]|jgi:putative hemolysin|nr:hemolysin family protein [Candidatus Woesearchaeota archaeon]